MEISNEFQREILVARLMSQFYMDITIIFFSHLRKLYILICFGSSYYSASKCV
jgi:hypothetical protein